MRKLNFLSKSSGKSHGLQSNALGFDRRSTVVRPSFDRRSNLLKLLSVLVLVLTFGVGQMWGADVVDELTASDLAASSTTYTNFSNVSVLSAAKYAGSSAKSSANAIQLRSKSSNSGIVSTTSGGTVKSVNITVESGSNTIDVYGSNTAYTDATDLYNSSKQGTKIGSLSATGTITFTDDYAYVGVRSNNGAIYLSKVEITWDDGQGGDTPPTPSTCEKKVTLSKGSATFDIDNSTGVALDCCDEMVVTLSNISIPQGKKIKAITQSGISGVTIDQENQTVTYPAESNGESTIDVTFEDIPSHTISFNINGGTCETTSASVKEGVVYTLPTVTGLTDICEYKTFAGWTQETSISGGAQPTDLKTTSITMGSSDIVLNAVYSKIGEGSAPVNDVLNRELTGKSGTSYGDWSGKTATSNAVYAGNSAGGNEAIQLRSTNNAGIITTASGGKATKVTVEWNSNTAATRTITIYGKNSAYSAASDLYGNNAGTSLGDLNIDNATNNVSELTITGDYEYIGIRSKSGALYLNSVTITWGGGASVSYSLAANCVEPECSNPEIGTQPVASASYAKGASSVTALTVAATGSGTLTYQWYSNDEDSNEGGTLIPSATSASYTPSVAAVGTFYYYCVVGIQGESCSATSNVATINVTQAITGITLNKNNTTLEVGGTETLTATIEPNDATEVAEWVSSAPSVATVDQDGVVTAVAAGSATITCKSPTDNTIKGECAVTVTPAPEYKKVTAALTDWSGEYLLVYENSASEAYVWTGVDAANNYATATISNGKITKPANGAKLTIASMEGGYSIRLECSGTNNGKYLSGTSGSNTTNFDNDASANTLGYSTDHATITSNTSNLTFNSANNNLRFRYFKSTSTQAAVQLYRKVVTSAVTITAPAEGTGLLTLADGLTPVASGDNIAAGTELTVTASPNTENHYIGGVVKVVKTDDPTADVTAQVLSGTTLTMPEYAITVSATFTPTYAITQSGEGGTIAWETSAGSGNLPAYFAEGTDIVITANADNTHTFTSLSLSNNVENPDIDGNVAMFSMPASDVTATVVFTEKVDPSVAITDGEDHPVTALNFGTPKKGDDVPAAQTFVISGANLKGALTVVSSNSSLYAVSYTEGALTPDANKEVEATITVTPQEGVTDAAGTKSANITISGEDLTPVVITASMTVQETYTVNWWINGGENPASSVTDVEGTEVTAPSDFSAFTACSDFHFIGWATSAITGGSSTTKPTLVTPVTEIGTDNLNYYAVFADGTPASTETIFNESLSSGISTTEWTFNKCYTLNSAVRMSTGSDPGTMTSPAISALDGDATLTFEVKAWSSTENGKVTLSASKGTFGKTSFTTSSSDDFEEVSTSLSGGDATTTITFTGTAGYRISIKNVKVTKTVAENFSKYYTTCPYVTRVNLSAPEVSNGSISFAQDSKAVTSVRTDGGADVVVDVVASPATGYELTNIALSGTAAAKASVNQAMTEVTIQADAEGDLTVTATFSQKNYSIAVKTYPAEIGADLTGATSTAKYGVEQTISTNEPTGYLFGGWYLFDASAFDAEDIDWSADLSGEIFTGTYEGGDLELEASFLMPDKNLVAVAYFDKIYTPAEALALDDLTDSVYVEGVISQVDEVSTQYKNATYWISADGTTTNQIKIYRGKHINKADVTVDNAAQIAVGNKVRVRGKLSQSSNVNQFGQGASYITVLVEKTLSALTIVGDASVTTYDVGDSFDKTGLSLSATYNTGYVQANYTGTTITSNYDAPTTFTAGVTSVTVSAEEGLISTSRDIPVTVSSAVLDHVEISAAAQTEFWAKEQYKEPLLDAYLTDDPATVLQNVTGVSNTEGLDMSVAGNKSVTVTYTRKVGQSDDVEYNFMVKPVVVEEANAHSVATAREIIDVDKTEGEDLELASESAKTHVVGVVTSVNALTGGNTGKYTIVIKDQTDADKVMTLYQVTLKSGITSVEVDDVIKAYGNLYYHAQSSKYEINTGGQVVAVVRTPNLTVADVAEMEINITDDLGVGDLTIDKDGSEGAITFSCTDPAVTIVENKLHAAAAGDATVTATMAASGEGAMSYAEATTTFNVHVIAERKRFAITMDKNGGSGEDPEYANQLAGATVDLPADNTYSKANSAFAGWVVNDGAVEITDGHFTMPAADVTIKATWNDVETCRISFQVSGSEVEYVEVPQTVEFNLAGVSHPTVEGFEFVGWSKTEYAEEVTALPITINSYTPALNEESKTLYGIYSQAVGSESNLHYVLDYKDENLATNTNWGDYTTAYDYTAADGGEWIIKAYKSSGMQINTGKSAYIKVPDCSAKIIQISLTCNSTAKKAVKFAETTSGDALATGTESTSQTLDLSGESVTTGYILPTGNCQITHIDVEYSGNVTYYTSSPVTRYNVTYAKGDATNVTGVCEAQRHAAGTITLCDAPTCADKNFAKWSDGSNLYNAGAEYTLSADVTFTATWTPKPKYTVTYTANGGTGTAPAVEEYMEGETVEVKENEYFSKPGFVYAGWQVVYNDGTDHIITPNDEGEFEMVAYNVTIKALWEEPSNQKWVRVESTDELDTVNGTNYIIVAKVNDAAMGALNGSYYNSIGIVKTGNYLNGPESMTKVTLAVGSEEGKYAMKNGTNYIYSTSAKNIGERTESFDWTITITNGEATINAGTAGKLQFNTGNPRFTTYTSSQQAVAIYREKALTPIDHDGMTEDDVNTYDDVEIGQDKTWTVSGEIEVGDVYMKEGAVIANSAEVTANDLYFKAKAGKSNQIFDLSKITVVSNLYYDFQLCDGDVDADYWYSISVPFDVNLNDGVFQVGGTTPLVNHSDFEVWEYDTQKRADTQSNGWKRSSDNMMHAGKAYLIGFNPGQPNIIRLKAAANWKEHLFSGNEMSVVSTGSGDHDNWNGLANPTGRYIDVDADAQVFNNNTHQFDPFTYDAQAYNFVVGTAFFVQSTSAITMSNTDHGQYRAPKREDDSKCAYAVRITRAEAASFDNQIIVRASEDATREYEQGHDMVTMNNATSKTAAMLWTKNYGGKRLAIEEAPFSGDKASYELGIYAPAAGEYAISVPAPKENADLYLTKNGMIIWNLSMNECTLTLDKGNNEGFGLLLVKKAPEVSTGVESTEFSDQNSAVQKVIIDEHVYILREGQMYDVTGKMVK